MENELNEREKNRIKNAFNCGGWDNAFNTIDDILEERLLARTKLTIDYMEIEQKEKTGGEQRNYWDEKTAKAYRIFLTLSEEVKKGWHLVDFKKALEGQVAYSPSTCKKKYEKFVKRYKEENTYEAKELRKTDDSLIKLAYEIEPPLG